MPSIVTAMKPMTISGTVTPAQRTIVKRLASCPSSAKHHQRAGGDPMERADIAGCLRNDGAEAQAEPWRQS